MPQRLSPRESRRLQRRFLGTDDDRELQPLILLAGASPSEPRPAPPPPRTRERGPYEWEYPVSDGYATQRTIIVP